MALEAELAKYQELLPSLLKEHEGQIAVIKGDDFLGCFDDMEGAYAALLPKYGFVQCLMRPVRSHDPVVDLRNIHFGVISVKR